MKLAGYVAPSMEYWDGRVDDEINYESFRWHQHIYPLDLSGSDFNSGEHDYNGSYIIIGYKVDTGIIKNNGRGGASKGPSLIRKNLSNKPCSFDQSLKIYDGGNIVCMHDDVELAQNTLSNLVELVMTKGMFPIIIGGGHDVAYGSMSGLRKFFPVDEPIGLINFDAHFDNRPYKYSTSGTMFRQIYDDFKAENRVFNHLTIGVQKSSNTVSLFKYAESVNSKYILAREILPSNKYYNTEFIKKFLSKNTHIYVTVCSDVFSTAFAPGVSSPQPLGINPEDFMEMFKLIIDSKKLACFDIAEVSPPLDHSQATVSLASIIIYTLVTYNWEINN